MKKIKYTVGIPEKCPRCDFYPFVTFLRGVVGRPGRAWYWPFKKRSSWAIICSKCKDIIGYEEDRVVDVGGMKHLTKAEKVLAMGNMCELAERVKGLELNKPKM